MVNFHNLNHECQIKLFVCVDRIGSNGQLPLNNQDLASKNVRHHSLRMSSRLELEMKTYMSLSRILVR